MVLGGKCRKDYERVAHPNSFIDVDDFETTADLAQDLLYLYKNPKKYYEYHMWRKTHYIGYYSLINRYHSRCMLCDRFKLINDTGNPPNPRDIQDWKNEETTCLDQDVDVRFGR